MVDIKDEPNSNLAAILLGSAAMVNGNKPNPWMDGGSGAREGVQAALAELIRRYKEDSSVAQDPALKPVTAALAGVQDISDMEEVSMAVKALPVPEYDEAVRPKKPRNPFAPRP